jgi:hypothetical protein
MYKTQKQRVTEYLLAHKKHGATNFEMMMKLHVCDVRKIISDIRNEGIYKISFEWETSKLGTAYKRYFIKKAK